MKQRQQGTYGKSAPDANDIQADHLAQAAGYAATPLLKKLGIKPQLPCWFFQPPDGYLALLSAQQQLLYANAALPLQQAPDGLTRLVQLFVCTMAELRPLLLQLSTSLAPDAVIWVSWPKKAVRALITKPVDLTEDLIRAEALTLEHHIV